jgi:Domain of unknown function (DUF1877)
MVHHGPKGELAMSMIGHLRAVTTTELKKLQEDPDSVKEFLHGRLIANSGKAKDALLRVQQMAMEAMAAGNSKNNEKLREQILRELESTGVQVPTAGPNEDGLSLEKSWHSLHYLLTGTSGESDSVLGKAILGGQEIGADVGYGPARYLEAPQVREIAKALKKMSKEDLTRRFDLKAMLAAKIYACHDESELELAQHYFAQVAEYYDEAAKRGDAMLLYLD